MDLTNIKNMTKLNNVRNFKMLNTGNIYNYPKVLFAQAKTNSIDTYPETRIEIEGEAVGTSPFFFELVPSAIRVVVGVEFKIY